MATTIATRARRSSQRRHETALACVLFCAMLAGRAEGQSAGVATDPDSALAEALGEIVGAPLALDASIGLALANATEVRAAEAQLLAARGSVKRERGVFDPALFAETEKRVEDQPTASFYEDVDVREIDERTTSGGARVRLPFGTELEASLETIRLETNSTLELLSPKYDTAGRLEIRQPVLKGFGAGTRSDLTAAERELEAAEADYQDVVISVRTEVEQTYWDLYAAERDLAVQRLIRDRALAFLEQAELRAQAGLVGPSEPANARVFLAQQEQAVLDREEEVDGISDRLASLMGERPPGGLPRYRPTDEPPRDFPIEPQDAVVARAIERNRALKASERIVESVRARARGARWNAYPTLDIVGSLGANGLSGRPREGEEHRTDIDGGFGQTWAQVRDREFPTWSAGVKLEIPIGFREGRGERDRLEAEVIRAEQEHLARVRELEELVRGSHRELENASRRLEVAENGVEASLEQVRIGVLEYDAGRSTAFELVRLGADLAEAQQRYSQALVRTAKAAAELRRLTSDGYPAAADAGEGGERHPSDGEG